MSFEFPSDEYSLVTELCDEKTCNPLKVWHDLGEPSSLSPDERELLRRSAQPLVSSSRSNGTVDIELDPNAVIYVDLKPNKITSDRGYDYDRVMKVQTHKCNR